MISGKLVHLIETNGDLIIDRVVAQIRSQSAPGGARTLLDRELRELGQDLLLHLGHWLTARDEQGLQHRAEGIGAMCFERDIAFPLRLRASQPGSGRWEAMALTCVPSFRSGILRGPRAAATGHRMGNISPSRRIRNSGPSVRKPGSYDKLASRSN